MHYFLIWDKGKSPTRGHLIMDELAITILNENMLLYQTQFLEEDTITFFKSLSSSI